MIDPVHSHAGVVVADLDASMERLGRDLGLQWAEVLDWELELETPDGIVTAVSRFTYSRGDGPGIELLQEQPGSVWTCDGHATHHLGFWSSDLVGDVGALQATGSELVATLAGAGPSGFAYLAHPGGGPLVELVDDALRPRFERWWAGGRF